MQRSQLSKLASEQYEPGAAAIADKPKLVIGYLAHDVYDKGIERRADIFVGGGAQVVTVGFRRQDPARPWVGGAKPYDLGRTHDAALLRRMAASLMQAVQARVWAKPLRHVDVVVAKTLEMLVLAFAARLIGGVRAPIVYECCDIHRTLLSPGLSGKLMRGLERLLLRHCAALITTSPAFEREYFRGWQGAELPILLLENKTYLPEGAPSRAQAAPRAAEAPWVIGWFGVIRCRKSLDFLIALTQRLPGLVEVVIAGRVAVTEIPAFDEQVAAAPGVRFIGGYEMSQLDELYGQVHFAWAIDYFEEGGNSVWLLPNRIYEGGAYDAIPIALADVETGRWLAEHELGVQVRDPVGDLEVFFSNLTKDQYMVLVDAAAQAPRSLFVTDQEAAGAIVDDLRQTVFA